MIGSIVNKFIFIFTLILPFGSLAQGKTKTMIVFVCEHGGARSTIASVYFNKMANENNLPYESVFRGVAPDSAIAESTRNGLTKDGFQTTTLATQKLSQKDIDFNTLLISLDCKLPSTYAQFQEWKGIPAISEDYNAARNEITRRLNELVKKLKKENIKNK